MGDVLRGVTATAAAVNRPSSVVGILCYAVLAMIARSAVGG